MTVREVLSEIDVRGKSVRLRPPRIEDAERVFGLIAGRREILDWIEWTGPSSAEEFREQARHWRKESDDAANYQMAILRVAQDAPDSSRAEQVVGAMSIRFIDHPDRGDLGYWIGVEHQGHGFASEAVGLVVWLAFEVLGAKTVSACVFVPNTRSRRALEKHGFELRDEAAACDQRPRWNFRLERESWSTRPDALRPIEFHFAFTPARP